MLIERLNLPDDLKTLASADLDEVASEVREMIVQVVSGSGGHLSASLGAVELTVALHSVFDSPRDKIVWDVGHQAYAHKILTGRLKNFGTLRQMNGLSGFPKKEESVHDIFSVGHASTAVSQALGIAKARDIAGKKHHVIAVIGDGSLSGGLALEGLNNALNLKSDLMIILNDNQMAISRSVGALSNYLTKLRTSSFYTATKDRIERLIQRIPRIGKPLKERIETFKDRVKHFLVDFKAGIVFEELGFKYFGPIDGHNIPLIMSTIQFARDVKGPVLVHVLTRKGKGYKPAEDDPTRFHGIGPFDRSTGKTTEDPKPMSYTSAFGKSLLELAASDRRIIGITAAMLDGTGLEEFAKKYPERFFDVGIAEEHAVSFASGLASQGFRPVVAIYSTFLQRSYDQIIHDVCLNNLPVIFAIDRAGLVGEDGATHHGMFDIAYLRGIPNMVIMAPKDEDELQSMLYTASRHNGPIAMRYPRGNGGKTKLSGAMKELSIGKGEVVHSSGPSSPKHRVLIVSVGSMVYPSIEAAQELDTKGSAATVINARFVKPIDSELIIERSRSADLVVTVEEGVVKGGFGDAVLEVFDKFGIRVPVKRLGLPDKFICHGKRHELLSQLNLDGRGIASIVLKELSR